LGIDPFSAAEEAVFSGHARRFRESL
jgi:hypothetical protein